MAKAHTSWRVLPHGPIERLTENIWRVEGTLENMALKRVMTIVKKLDGSLVIHSAVALNEDAMRAIDAFGQVSAIVIPNGYHRLDAPSFAQRYPNAKIYAPTGSRAKVEEVVSVDGSYEQFPADDSIELVTLDGTNLGEGVMIVKSMDGTTIVFNDAIFNMPHPSGFGGLVVRYILGSSGGPKISRITRLFLIKNKADFRSHLEKLANSPQLKRIIVSHHEIIAKEPRQVLLGVASSL